MKILNKDEIFGSWTVLESNTTQKVMCICECGLTKYVNLYHLLSGVSTKCRRCNGKKNTELFGKPNRKTKTYKIYKQIVRRCKGLDKTHPYYNGMDYITFDEFFSELGEKPNGKYSVDRIDNNKGYISGNLRWATVIQQQRNTRKNIWIYDEHGSKHLLIEVCEKYNLKYNTARQPRYRSLLLNDLINACYEARRD